MQNLALTIHKNAETINTLKARIVETFESRDRSNSDREAWCKACATFHRQYDDLFFPDGVLGWTSFLNSDPAALEAAILFLEVGPYFFRSGYLKQRIWKRLKRAELSLLQENRLEHVAFAYLERRVRDEFWEMLRYMKLRGSAQFWHEVTRQSQKNCKAVWLLLGAKNYPVRQWVEEEVRRAKSETGYVSNFVFTNKKWELDHENSRLCDAKEIINCTNR